MISLTFVLYMHILEGHICTNLHYESDCILSACVYVYDRIAAHTHIHTDVNRRTPFDRHSFVHLLFLFSLFNMTATYRLQLPLFIITYVIFSSTINFVKSTEYSKLSHLILFLSWIGSWFYLFLFKIIRQFENKSKDSCWAKWYKYISGWNSPIALYCFKTTRCYCNVVLEWFLHIR